MDLNKTALVLIDVQKESSFGIEGVNEAVKNAKDLIEKCRSLNIPIIYTRHLNRADQVGLSNGEPLKEDDTPIYYSTNTENIDIIEEIAPHKEDIVLDKYRWSSFYETSLHTMLQGLGVKHVIIGGFVTDGCLMTTVFDGYFRNYQLNLVKDICGATNEGAHMASILIMANWVYDLNIYNSSELIKKLDNKEHHVWSSPCPDSLQFTPENMREVFKKLDK